MERKDLVDKKTNEVILKGVDYVYDPTQGIYYVQDEMYIENSNSLVNIYFVIDDDYYPVGLVYNDHSHAYSMLPENKRIDEVYEDYKFNLRRFIIKEIDKNYNHYMETNDKFIKQRKRVKSHGKENGAN